MGMTQQFLAGEQFSVVWTGQVLESQRSGSVASLNCENAQTGMKSVGLRLHYQWPCSLALYSTRCRANKEDARPPQRRAWQRSHVLSRLEWQQ